MKTIAIKGEARTILGKKGSKADRKNGRIPCVIYGGGDPVHLSVTFNDVKSLIFTPEFKLAEITIDGNTYKCIVKDYQLHPLKDNLTHIDFLQLVDGKSIKINVPVKFIGVSPGEKSGGKLIQNLRRVSIKTTPEKMVNELSLDISSLQLNDSIRIRDIKPEDGVEVLNPPAIPVAIVEVPRALRSAEDAAAKEGEVVGDTDEAAEGEEATAED